MSVKLTQPEVEALAAAVWQWTDSAFDSDPLCAAVEKIVADRLAARDERIDQAVSRAELSRSDTYDDQPVYVQGHLHSEPVCAWPDCSTHLTREQMAVRR